MSTLLGTLNTDSTQNMILARSSADYRVTPGDIYTLTYAAATSTSASASITPVSYVIVVDTSYRIRVSNMGIVNGSGKTFMQVKSEVETIVANNYPLSGVQLALTQPAIFRVHIKGEVYAAGEVSAWALNRLSSLITIKVNRSTDQNTQTQTQTNKDAQTSDSFLTPFESDFFTHFTSLRDVSIRSSNGQTRVYDLFKAMRLGDLSQDPYLRPGDEITFNRVKRSVTITGEVERPGVYQLLDDENVKELINYYGSGFTLEADKTRVELTRLANSVEISGDKIFLTEKDLANNYSLENYDKIVVPKITQLQPVMFVEGAVTYVGQLSESEGQMVASAPMDLIASNRLIVPFHKGETYASLIRNNSRWFTAVSDTQNAYIVRNDERIPINLNPMLYDSSYRGEVLVQENDVLIIPFRQYFVTVAGAVMYPGRYPYIPDRSWDYYIALAGGFVAERNTRESIVITDMNGVRMKKTDAILPETVITANTNHLLHYWNQYIPVLATILSLITTFFSIQLYMTR
jgi:protein involved in polysaccharide export with SLBB domain